MVDFDTLPIELPIIDGSIIKVIGVGGGGGNAVNHMYSKGISDVNFVVCNTDNQALIKSPIPNKIQLGPGLGAGGNPEVARKAAEESIDKIQNLLKDNTRMVFVTAGMGGGTGTGASPVVAKAAHDMGILTVGIVTIPFAFEGTPKIRMALEGVAQLNDHVDAMLVINNEKLKQIYPDLELSNAFAKADDILTNAAKAIAEIITIPGYINTDFADVYSILKDGNVAIMNTGYASGENRISKAIEDALTSPLLNTNDISGAGKILLSFYCSTQNQIKMEEVEQIHEFMSKMGEDVQVIWGASFDDTLGDKVKITIIATGFDVSDIPGMPASAIKTRTHKQTHAETKTEQNSVTSFSEIQQESLLEELDVVLLKEQSQSSKIDTQKAYKEYYEKLNDAQVEENEPEIIEKQKPEQPIVEEVVFTLDELENNETLTKIENIPAWKRRFMRK